MKTRKVSEENILQRQQLLPPFTVRAKFLDFWVENSRQISLSVAGALSFHSAFSSAFRRATDTKFDESENELMIEVN